MTGRTTVRVAGRELGLSNLERVMYPGDDREPAVTKAELVAHGHRAR